jgi:tetratricopeptide (TPR) repeat protein
MDVDAALELADALVFAQTGEPFNDLQKEIFKGAWQGLTYEKIADSLGYNDSYIKEEGARLCQILSEALGEKVTKPKFRAPLERRWRAQQSENISSPHALVVDRFQPSAPDLNFVGRESAIAHLNTLVRQSAKVILIQAKGGVGKTTLARKYLQQQFDSYIEFPIAKERQNITSIESLIEERLKQLGEEPGREFGVSLDRLKRKLEAERIGVLIDNLEPALDGNGKFIEPHRRYVELLRVLANPEVQSVTLITSRECLRESAVTVRHYLLDGLEVAAWQEFFNSRNLQTETPALSAMHKAYGGNAKAMEILSSAIIQDYDGNLEAYWQANQGDLLIERDLEDLVASQFNRLQQLNSDAYKLLCRIGCYRYQDVSTVPEEGLFCLLWDVLESQRRRVVKLLRARSLVEFRNGEYWLHPVIRAEAIARLRASQDWEVANCKAAEFWTESIATVETIEDAVKAFEAYYHYVEINYFEQAAAVITKDRINKHEYSEPLGSSIYRIGISEKIMMVSSVLNNIQPGYNLARIYEYLGDSWSQKSHKNCIEKALECYKESKNIAKKFKIKRLERVASLNIGLIKINVGELEEAMEYFADIEASLCSQDTDTDTDIYGKLIWSRFCLAFLKSCLGLKQEASILAEKVYYELLTARWKLHKYCDPWITGHSFYYLGSTYKNLGKPEKAFEMYQEAITFATEINYDQIKGKALDGLGELEREYGDLKKAFLPHSEAIDILDKKGDKPDLAEAYYQLGLTYQKMGEVQKSQENFDIAIQLFSDMPAPKQVEKVRQAMENGG